MEEILFFELRRDVENIIKSTFFKDTLKSGILRVQFNYRGGYYKSFFNENKIPNFKVYIISFFISLYFL